MEPRTPIPHSLRTERDYPRLISLVIPLYNEQESLPALRIALKSLAIGLHCPVEFVFVDDGSVDLTASQLRHWALGDERVKVLFFARNFGHQAAITAGLDYAAGDAVVIMDGDLQDPPELIFEMIAQYRRGFDVVYAQRTVRLGETWLKRLTAKLFYGLMKRFVQKDLPTNTGDFRLMSFEAVRAFRALREGHRFIRGMVTWVGFSQIGIPYERPPRVAGKTKFPFRKMMAFAWDGILSFSSTPLRLGIYLGLISLLFGGFITGRALWLMAGGIPLVRGWTTLVVMISTIGGSILISLGLIGEYVGRIYEEIKCRPLYIVQTAINLAPLNLPRSIPATNGLSAVGAFSEDVVHAS
jgi:glycosyltransferase involved in cell wall biosynthesis